MEDIGVRELKTHASEIIRRVKEQRVHYIVTHRGKAVGLLTPLDETRPILARSNDLADESAWDTLTRLGAEIGAGWNSAQTSDELLSEMRR